jgi:putative oxidoreductase
MIFDKIMSDPGLCAVCVILLVLWAGTHRFPMKASFDLEKALITFFRIFCGFLLVYSTRDKLLDPSHFMTEVDDYHFLPSQLVPLAAAVIPWIELFAGAALMLGAWWRGGAVIFCALMVIYSDAISWAFARGLDIGCGCGLADPSEKITWLTVVRDLLFLALGLAVLFARSTYVNFEKRK